MRPSSLYYNVSTSDFPNATYVKCSLSDYWTIPMTLEVNGSNFPIGHALLDSGTSLIVFPSTILNQIYNQYFSHCTLDITGKYRMCNCRDP
jgi:hypothetical protein